MMTTENKKSSLLSKSNNPGNDLHPVDWKSGTEALALCMICGGEYPADKQECPDCNVSLSVVRRCPHCLKIVSAQHKKCVYCHTPFTNELPKHRPALDAPLAETSGVSSGVRRLRAALVSVSTFVLVFMLGLMFLHKITQPVYSPHVIATAHVVHSTDLRRAPSTTASNLGSAGAGAMLSITGFESNNQGRWITVRWNDAFAYLPASDISAPHVTEADAGAGALKFYISGMGTEAAGEAIKSVDDYAQRFPRDPHAKELRFTLAERLRALAETAGPKAGELREEADQLYKSVADGQPSTTAGDARQNASRHAARPRQSGHKKDGVQIIGGSGTRVGQPEEAPRSVVVLK